MGPKIVTKSLPGPSAKKIIAKDAQFLATGNWRYLPFVPAGGSDVWLRDVDGNVFLDFVSGAAVLNVGINNPRVNGAIRAQLEKLTYPAIPGYFYHELVSRLCEKLADITPNFAKTRNKKVCLGLSGADATDTAMKIARFQTKRWRFISFVGANHGLATYGALSLQGLSASMAAGFGPFVPGITIIPYPYPLRPTFGSQTPEEEEDRILDYIEYKVFKSIAPPGEFAGIFVEPIQGDGGVLVPTKGFFRRLSSIARENGILLIVDEIQTGLGRTGKMFASEHFDLVPDMMLLGKPLGAGLPMSAVVGRSDLMDLPGGSHALTTAGNLLGCAATIASIEEIQRRKLAANAARVGSKMKKALKAFMESKRAGSEYLADVRGLGLLIGVEVVQPRTKEPGIAQVKWINRDAFEHGLLSAFDGLYGNVFRLMPSLTIQEKDALLGVSTLLQSFAHLSRNEKRSRKRSS